MPFSPPNGSWWLFEDLYQENSHSSDPANDHSGKPEIRRLPRPAALRKGLMQNGLELFRWLQRAALNQRIAPQFCDGRLRADRSTGIDPSAVSPP
jgi:hypothetical protein